MPEVNVVIESDVLIKIERAMFLDISIVSDDLE